MVTEWRLSPSNESVFWFWVEKLDNDKRPVMAHRQPVGLFGVFLKTMWKGVPTQMSWPSPKALALCLPWDLSSSLSTLENPAQSWYQVFNSGSIHKDSPCIDHVLWPSGRWKLRVHWQSGLQWTGTTIKRVVGESWEVRWGWLPRNLTKGLWDYGMDSGSQSVVWVYEYGL